MKDLVMAPHDRNYDQQLREMNAALLVSAASQHELTEQADRQRDSAEAARNTAEKLSAALRESEQRYRTLFDAMDEGYCIIEVLFDAPPEKGGRPVDYRFIEVNGSFERQAGLHDVVGKRMLEFVPAIEPHWLNNYGKVALTGEGVRFSGEYKGLHRYFDVYAFRTAGWPERHVAVLFADVTQRQRAADQLRESEARFRELVEQVEDYAIFRTDPAGRATTWNAGVERVLGFKEADFLGKDIVPAIFTPEDIQNGVPQRELEEAAATGSASNDRWMQRQDGSRFFAAGVTTALRDSGSRLVGFTKVMRDQTERKRIELALEESEERHRRLFETAQDGILVLDAKKGRIIDANPFIADLLGYQRDELVGKELWQIGLLKDKQENEAMFRDLQAKGVVRYDHLPLENKHGKQIQVEFISNTYVVDHRPVAQCNIRDITDRVHLEETTKEQGKSLADLNRRKDEFLAMLSHELRNPLAPIMNAVQLLRLQRDRSPLQVEAHGMIDRQVAQLARLVDDLLEVSRITTGRIHLQEERLDLCSIVRRAVETTTPQCGQKGQTVATSLPDDPVWVNGDSTRLEQVVVNVLNNACKYTERGGHIWIGLEQKGDEAVLRVRDNGMGIAPELLPRIFDLFTQAEKSLDRSQGGLGIGLSLVQSLVTMHRGRVEAHSTPGEGSEFVVYLPAMASPDRAAPAPAAVTDRPAHSLQLLVVDDNVDAANGMARLLQSYGHEARIAHDGAAAMQAALELIPQVVLLDIGLPVMDGYQVARWIREEPALKGAVLIAMTGYGQESDRQRSREAGFDHHLVKPVDFAKVETILSAVAANAGLSAPGAAN